MSMPILSVETMGDAALLTIDRSETHHAVDRALGEVLVEAVTLAGHDPRVRGIIITSVGDRTFMSGGDLNMIAGLIKDQAPGDAILDLGDALAVIEQVPVPVIAAVQGDVYGGGSEFLLLCDLVVMESHAGLAFRHAKMGLSPAWGGLTRLVERVGPLEAARLLYTAEKIDAAEAFRLGLVNEVVPKGASKARAQSLVARIADNPRSTVAALKRALRHVRETWRSGTAECEREAFRERWGNADHRNAMNAFLARK